LGVTEDREAQLESYKREIAKAWQTREDEWSKKFNRELTMKENWHNAFLEAKNSKSKAFWKGVGTGAGIVGVIFTGLSLIK